MQTVKKTVPWQSTVSEGGKGKESVKQNMGNISAGKGRKKPAGMGEVLDQERPFSC